MKTLVWTILGLLVSTPVMSAPIGDGDACTPEVVQLIASKMKDPDSVKVRNCKAYDTNGDLGMICGEVNARNSYGGYTGFKKFALAGDSLKTEESMQSASLMATMWRIYCH